MRKKKIKKIRNKVFIIFIFVISFIIGFTTQRIVNYVNVPVEVKYDIRDTKVENSVSMVMIGDNLIHSPVWKTYYNSKTKTYDFSNALKYIKDYIKTFDIAYYNQETILGGTSLGLSSYPQFNTPQEAGDAFIDAGFNLVSLATNHSMDNYYNSIGYNGKAIISARSYWNKKMSENSKLIATGIATSQEERDEIKIVETNGIKYAFFSYTRSTNGITVPSNKKYLVNVYSDSLVKSDIEKVKGKVDLIIVAMHWGEEGAHYPNSDQKRIAAYLSSLGVNVVIGCHSHVVQPITYINDTLVIYSLGNSLSNQAILSTGTDNGTGLMASCNIKKTTYHGKVTIKVEDPTAVLTYTPGQYSNEKHVIIPYNLLTNSILNNYQSIYKKQMSYVKAYYSDIIEGEVKYGNS